MKGRSLFVVASNPEPDSKLPYLLRLPLEGGLVLKARETWPTTSRVYCHRFEGEWPADADVLEEVPVASCRRRGAAVDLVLDRPRLARSQFVFTEVRGRPAIFWQTQKTARGANPGGRIPRRRILEAALMVAVDTSERYPYRFANQAAETIRTALPAGDYAVHAEDGTLLAAVERKSLENLAATLSDGTLSFQMQRLSELPLAAVVVEGRYSGLYRLDHVSGAWLADQLSRLEVRYPEVRVVSQTPGVSQKTGRIGSCPRRSPTLKDHLNPDQTFRSLQAALKIGPRKGRPSPTPRGRGRQMLPTGPSEKRWLLSARGS